MSSCIEFSSADFQLQSALPDLGFIIRVDLARVNHTLLAPLIFNYYDILEYFYKHHSIESANKKASELIELPIILENNPFIGRTEPNLSYFNKAHRYFLYYTNTKAIKIIYFVDELSKTVYITDFFPYESDNKNIPNR